MRQFDEVSIQRACAKLISVYAYLNDERRFEELADLFTDDAVLYRPSAPDQPIEGRQNILLAFQKRPPDTLTFHICTDIVVDVQSEDLAQGRSRILMLSTVRAQSGAAQSVEGKMPIPGVFRDTFKWTETGWKFAERRGCFWI